MSSAEPIRLRFREGRGISSSPESIGLEDPSYPGESREGTRGEGFEELPFSEVSSSSLARTSFPAWGKPLFERGTLAGGGRRIIGPACDCQSRLYGAKVLRTLEANSVVNAASKAEVGAVEIFAGSEERDFARAGCFCFFDMAGSILKDVEILRLQAV
jgi:hypothetical protein